MRNLKKYFTIALWVCCVLASPAVFGQKASVAQKADEAFEQKQYLQALSLYENALDKVRSNRLEKSRIQFQIAECYRYMANYTKAINSYKRLIRSKYYNIEPKIYFYMAEAYRFSNDYESAKENYNEYLKLQPNDKFAQSQLASLLDFNTLINERTRHILQPMDILNTEYNDWAPRFIGDDTTAITLTSSRIDSKDAGIDGWTGQGFSDIYVVRQDRVGKWLGIEPFDKDIVNTSSNEGEAVFSPDGNTVYFSRCITEKGKSLGCYIYTSSRATTKVRGKKSQETAGEWSEAIKLNLGDSAYNYLYPAISSDGLTLYFSSDLPDSEGDYDIFMSTRASVDGAFGKAVNVGKGINTEGKDVYPVLRNDTCMYFSSTGHRGMGGLDLFRSELVNGTWTNAVNLGYPINTTYDEIGIIYYPDGGNVDVEERGYFSSNRPSIEPHGKDAARDSKRKKQKEINDDIYYFELPALIYAIEGTVRDDKSMQLLPDAKIRLVSSDGTEAEVYTNKKGFFRFGPDAVKRNNIYKLYISKVDYFTQEATESTKGYTTNKDIVRDIRLIPVPKQPVVLPEIRYDLAKWDLKEDFQDSLLDLYSILIANPSIMVELRSHTDCRPFPSLTNDTLSQRRAQSVVDYLVSRGIEPERLIAKGYGERVPRSLEKELKTTYKGKTYTFRKGLTLSCEYIKYLKSKDEQDAAHSLNRRTEFSILRTDFVSKKLVDNFVEERPKTEEEKIIDLVTAPKEEPIEKPKIIQDESLIPITMIQSSKGEVPIIVNGAQMVLLIDEQYKDVIAFSWEEAMNFIYQRRITKDDFPERDNAFDPEGNILNNSILVLKTVKIGQNELENVEVVVVKGLNHKMVMNRNGLRTFGSYSFDKQKGILQFVKD